MTQGQLKSKLVRETMQEWKDGQPGCAGRENGEFCLKELRRGMTVYKSQPHLLFCSVACAKTGQD